MTLHLDIVFKGKTRFSKTRLFYCLLQMWSRYYWFTIALDKMKKDFPNLETLYAKSDNGSSCHVNFYKETLYQLCCKRQIKLRRYHQPQHSEPCCGKDQYDNEFVSLNQDKFDSFSGWSFSDIWNVFLSREAVSYFSFMVTFVFLCKNLTTSWLVMEL